MCSPSRIGPRCENKRVTKMVNFTPVSAAIGGVLIGLAATLLMLFNGRVAGISSILAACLNRKGSEIGWSATFILGLVLAPLSASAVGIAIAMPQMPESWTIVIVGGVLVGFGSRLGGGCTSGHGVCGVARLSVRSIVATVTFMTTAIVV